VLATIFELGAQHLAASAIGPHVALPVYCAAYAWDQRSVFWRYTVPVLGAYAVLVPLWLGGGAELLPHALAGLVAWGLGRMLPSGADGGASSDVEDAPAPTSTLGLRD